MRGLTLMMAAMLLMLSCSGPEREIDPEVLAGLAAYIENNHQAPEEYVLGKFADHDVIFLGEVHRNRHDVEFIINLIPDLHGHGVPD